MIPAGGPGRTMLAATVYFAIVFVIAFGLGTVRVLQVVPRLGETNAVLIEAPVLLAISWLVAGWAVRRFAVPPRTGFRVAMGAVAFALLIAAEAALAVSLFGRSINQFVAAYGAIPGAIGLAAQLGFAAMPLLRLRLGEGRSGT